MVLTILKNDGSQEPFQKEKLISRINNIINAKYKPNVDIERIIWSVMRSISPVTSAAAIDRLLAEKAADLSFLHPHYDYLAGQIALDILQKQTPPSFSSACQELATGEQPILSALFMSDVNAIREDCDTLAQTPCHHEYTLSAVRALEHLCLLKKNGNVVERPQYMFLRVAVALHGRDIARVSECFDHLLHHLYMFSTSILAHAGTVNAFLASSYSLSIDKFNSTADVFHTLAQTAQISSAGGGMGVNFSACPSIGTPVTDSTISQGLPPVLQLFDSSLSVSLGWDGRKPQAITSYIEPWHADIFLILNMKRSTFNESNQLKNLTQALWLPDLFMSRARDDEPWSLFSPNSVPLLVNNHSASFNATYVAYETSSSIDRTVVSARALLSMIAQCQIETGGPYILYKDTINACSNQSNIGLITQSSLCTEVMQVSTPSETAVCTMASIVLPSFVHDGVFSFQHLHSTVQFLTIALNMAISISSAPTLQCLEGNSRHRALGIGIQGLADTFIALDLPFDSDSARDLNIRLAQTVYHAALCASVSFAKVNGCYSRFRGSPLSQGKFQFDLWQEPQDNTYFDWDLLRKEILTHGLANSLLIAHMPTSGTCQFTACSEGSNPLISNVITKRIVTTEYRFILPSLVQRLTDEGIWSPDIRRRILISHGSIQGIPQIPHHIKTLFRTAWEISYDAVVDLAIDRGPYCCQSQSLSIYMEDPSISKLTALHYSTWRAGLKTGLYRLFTRSSAGFCRSLLAHPDPPSSPSLLSLSESTDGNSDILIDLDTDDSDSSESIGSTNTSSSISYSSDNVSDNDSFISFSDEDSFISSSSSDEGIQDDDSYEADSDSGIASCRERDPHFDDFDEILYDDPPDSDAISMLASDSDY